jgi:transposase-like protein
MATPITLTREALIALLTEHGGNITAAAAAAGTTSGALYRRIQRAGLSMRVPRWGSSRPEPPTPSDAFALAAVDLAVENQGLLSTVARQEVLIDHLVQQAEHLAKEAGARDDSPKDFTARNCLAGRARFLAALKRLRAAPSPEPA